MNDDVEAVCDSTGSVVELREVVAVFKKILQKRWSIELGVVDCTSRQDDLAAQRLPELPSSLSSAYLPGARTLLETPSLIEVHNRDGGDGAKPSFEDIPAVQINAKTLGERKKINPDSL